MFVFVKKIKREMRERKNIRLQNWDYSTPADYFITICTKNREHYFGEIAGGVMQLSNTGVIAYVLWWEIKNHAKNVELGEFVVMPNHIHGIITITGQPVGTGHALSLREPSNNTRKTRFQNIGKNSISAIIGSYKSAVTKYARKLGYEFEWQTRFYDNIIRTAADYNRIAEYIKHNPQNWTEDKFFNE